MMSNTKRTHRCSDHRYWAALAAAFGLGMTFSCFSPEWLVLLVAAVIITALGITVIRH